MCPNGSAMTEFCSHSKSELKFGEGWSYEKCVPAQKTFDGKGYD